MDPAFVTYMLILLGIIELPNLIKIIADHRERMTRIKRGLPADYDVEAVGNLKAQVRALVERVEELEDEVQDLKPYEYVEDEKEAEHRLQARRNAFPAAGTK